MIVLDASCLVELLVGTQKGRTVAARIADPGESLHVPHLADVEVMQTIRRLVRDGDLDGMSARTAIEVLRSLDLERHAHEPLLDRVWALRQNLSANDAVYVALAEALDCSLLTCDARLTRPPGLSRRVELIK